MAKKTKPTPIVILGKGWRLTPWQVAPEGGKWSQQPFLCVDDEPPFYADHPQPYIDRL